MFKRLQGAEKVKQEMRSRITPSYFANQLYFIPWFYFIIKISDTALSPS
jgi:hypothetical protein